MFTIKDGSEKEILVGDFIECLGRELPYDPEDGWEYEVMGTNEASQELLCLFHDGEGWVSSSLIDVVWRIV